MGSQFAGSDWRKVQIRNTDQYLGYWCWAALGLMWAIFARRLNRVADRITDRFSQAEGKN